MALIDGGRVSEGAWLKVITGMLAVIMVLGTIVWGRIEATLDTVIDIQIMQGRHAVEISEIKRRLDSLELVRGGKTMLLPSDTGNPPFRFRGRAGEPKRDIPRPPHDLPHDPPTEPAPSPKPKPRDEKRDGKGQILPVSK